MAQSGSRKRPYPERRRKHADLGALFKTARAGLTDPDTGKTVSVLFMARLLGVKPGFVYQVEQGIRKPQSGKLEQWASVYGIRRSDLYRCLGTAPMDLVATLRPDLEHTEKVDPLLSLTKLQRSLLLPYSEFVRWQAERLVSTNRAGDHTSRKEA